MAAESKPVGGSGKGRQLCPLKNINVPNTVVEIDDFGFSLTNATYIKCGKGLKRLGNLAFQGNKRAATIEYPSEKSRLLNSIFTCELCGKNAMFNLNENNRIVMAQHPTDMRMGVNCLSGQVRMVGLDPSNGDVYIFVGKSRQVMKILHWEYGGYVVYYKRLEEGRFHPRIFLRQGVGFRSMKWSELVLLMEGISPKAARRHRYEKS